MSAPKRGRPRKWKQCPQCRRRKLIEADYYRWTDGDTVRVSAQCKVCVRARRRAAYERTVADPYLREQMRKRQRSWEAEQRKRKANPERCKRYRERLKAERPEVYRQQLEDARIRNRLRNERIGKPEGVKTAKVDERIPRIDAGPLLDFVHLAMNAGQVPDPTDARTVFRLVHEGKGRVSMLVADRLVTALGGTFSTVYPELYA